MRNTNFAVFILTHGRASNIITLRSLRRAGYTGKIYILIDNEDPQQDSYINNYGSSVIVFDKKAYDNTFDIQDNFKDQIRGVVYARNANFDISKKLGLKYFAQFDDDYVKFQSRYNNMYNYKYKGVTNLDKIFDIFIDFLKNTTTKSIAMAQGGDFIGGEQSSNAQSLTLKRKVMNTFFYKTEDPVEFIGRINEDVNMYVNGGTKGKLYFTFNGYSIVQKETQSNEGGLTDLYLEQGTYVKSFYTVMISPSSVKIRLMGNINMRLHHSIKWNNTVPKIIRANHRKTMEVTT